MPHGKGLLIVKSKGIIEGHFNNGVPYKQCKILAVKGRIFEWSSLISHFDYFKMGNIYKNEFYGYAKSFREDGHLI